MRARPEQPPESLAAQTELLGKLVFRAGSDQPELDRLKTELTSSLNRLSDRLQMNRLAPPLAVALIGPTGVGKSKVFSSLAGRNLSPSGYKRPTTPQPLLAAAPGELDKFASPHFLPLFRKVKVKDAPNFSAKEDSPTLYLLEADRLTPGLALIDAPDFDSVLAANRAAAIQIFQRCDAVVIVADEGKYADQALWEFIVQLKDRPRESFVLLNRAGPQAAEVAGDWQRRLRAAGLDLPLAVWPEEPRLQDHELLRLDFEDGRRLRNWLVTAAAGRKTLQEAIIKAEQAHLQAGLGRLLKNIDRQLEEYALLEKVFSDLHNRALSGLDKRLTVNLSDEVKAALLEKLKELFSRFDVLAKPRQYLLAPFRALKDGWRKLTGPPRNHTPAADWAEVQEISQLLAEGGEALVVVARELGRRQIQAAAASSLGPGFSERPDFKNLPLSPDEIRNAYQASRQELEEWVAEETRQLVNNLGLGEKTAFYTAQVVTMGLIVSLQIHTGGGFSLLDGLTDGLAAPILARLAGAAISKDKIKALEVRAAARHLAGAEAILEKQTKRFLDYLESARAGLSAAAELKKLL